MADPLERENLKRELRARMRGRRERLAADEVERAAVALDEQMRSAHGFDTVGALAGYSAIRGEMDPSIYLERRHAQGARLYFPRVEAPGRMAFVAVEAPADLHPGAFGVREPVGPAAALDAIELFLVPGLAFDHQGRRLGFGGGYYDRALEGVKKSFGFNEVDAFALNHAIGSRCRVTMPILVGVCYHWQLLEDEIPVEAHDIAMDVIATDRALYWCAQGR